VGTTIAAEAYGPLSPTLKTKVTNILKAHPDYEKWKESFTGDSANLDLSAFIFIRSSTWPDEIRRCGNQYDHPKWHLGSLTVYSRTATICQRQPYGEMTQ
jgi:hypothetical protein